MSGEPWDGRNVVYRFFTADGTCLYVGCTKHFTGRLNAHRKQPWARSAVRTRVTLHPDRRTALDVEAAEIMALRPIFNEARPALRLTESERVRIGAVVRELRTKRGIRAGDLAAQIGISRPYLLNIEAGRKPLRPQIVPLLAIALSVPKSLVTPFSIVEDVA